MGGGTGLMILGGLLQGAGKGIENEWEARRQEALLDLKRQYEIEDRDANNTADVEKERIRTAGNLAVVKETGAQNRQTEEVKGEQDRKNEAVKAENKAAEIRLTKGLDLSNDKVIEQLKHKYALSEIDARSLADTAREAKLAHIEVDHYEVAANGQIVIWKKDGTAFIRGGDGAFVPKGSKNDDDEDTTITGERASRAAPAAQAPKPAAKKPDQSVLAQLRRLPPPGPGQSHTATGPNGLKAHWNGQQWVLDDVNGG